MRIAPILQLVVFEAAFSLFAPAALAQTASDAPPPLVETLSGGAKQDYEAGKRLYESGDYSGALSKLQSASRASNDPRLLWDAAVCERAMQHYARASALVHRYLDSHSPIIEPEAVRRARDFLDAAEPLTAHLDVESNQSDAVVLVDEEPLGTVPLGPSVRVDRGTHQVTVKKREFNDYTVTLTITGSADVRVRAVLSPIVRQGRVIVRASAEDTIAIDGVPVAVGTWESMLPSGRHSVVVTEPGSPPFESQIVVVDNQTLTVNRNAVDVTTTASKRAGFPSVAGIPKWVWFVASGVLVTGVVAAGYVLLRSPDPPSGPMPGSVGLVNVPSR